MKTNKTMCILVAIALLLCLLVYAICRWWPSGERLREMILDLYIKMISEK